MQGGPGAGADRAGDRVPPPPEHGGECAAGAHAVGDLNRVRLGLAGGRSGGDGGGGGSGGRGSGGGGSGGLPRRRHTPPGQLFQLSAAAWVAWDYWPYQRRPGRGAVSRRVRRQRRRLDVERLLKCPRQRFVVLGLLNLPPRIRARGWWRAGRRRGRSRWKGRCRIERGILCEPTAGQPAGGRRGCPGWIPKRASRARAWFGRGGRGSMSKAHRHAGGYRSLDWLILTILVGTVVRSASRNLSARDGI